MYFIGIIMIKVNILILPSDLNLWVFEIFIIFGIFLWDEIPRLNPFLGIYNLYGINYTVRKLVFQNLNLNGSVAP